MTISQLAAVILFVLLAGCSASNPPDGTGSNTSSTSGSSTSTTSEKPGEAPPGKPAGIEWTACIGAGALAYGPNVIIEPSVPPGWESTWPIDGLYYAMFQCERMSVGPYERGPVRGVIEQFSAFSPAEACTEGDYTQSSMMANWWIDDAEIAALLAGLGMPVHYVPISIEPTMVADAGTHTWRWGAGANESSMTFETNQALSDGFHRIQRIFWPTDAMTAVGIMDLDMQEEFDVATTAAGQLAPPSLYAFTGTSMPFAGGSGAVYTGLELSASLRYFGDLRCEQPQS